MMSQISLLLTVLLSLMGLGIAWYYMRKVVSIPLDLGLNEEEGKRLRFIHGAIARGAMAFLKQEYRVLTIFMLAFALVIAVLIDDTHTPDYREGRFHSHRIPVRRRHFDRFRLHWDEGRHPGQCAHDGIGETRHFQCF